MKLNIISSNQKIVFILLVVITILCSISFAEVKNYNFGCVAGDTCTLGSCINDRKGPCDTTNPLFCGCCIGNEKWDSSIRKCAKVDWTATGDNSNNGNEENNSYEENNENVSLKLVLIDNASLEDTGIDSNAPQMGEKGYCKYLKEKTGYLCDENEKGCSYDNECKNGLTCKNEMCTKKTNLNYPLSYNDATCTKKSECKNRLVCTDEFGTDNVELGICCYEWQTKDDKTGNCVIKSREGDLDSDENKNFGEDELYASPINDGSKPLGAVFDFTCTNYFGERDNNILTTGAANVARYAAQYVGMLEGAASGLKDDIMVIPDLINTGSKLIDETKKGNIDWSDMKLPSVKEIWDNLIQLNVDEVVDTSLAVNIYNKYKDECVHNSHNKGFVTGHYTGYLTEQIGITFVPIAGIAVKAGKVGSVLGKVLEASLRALDLLLNGLGKVFDKVMAFIKDTHFELLLKWDDTAKRGFAKAIMADEKFAKTAVEQFGAAGAHKIGVLCDSFDTKLVKQFVNSANGAYLLRSLSADELYYLFKTVPDVSEEQFAKFLNSMEKDDLKAYTKMVKQGKRLAVEDNSFINKVGGDSPSNIPKKNIDDEIEKQIAKDNFNKIKNTYGNEIADDVGSEFVDRVVTIASKLTSEEGRIFLKTLQEISSKYGQESAQATVKVIEKHGKDVIDDINRISYIPDFGKKIIKLAGNPTKGNIFELKAASKLKANGYDVKDWGAPVKNPITNQDVTDLDIVVGDKDIFECKFDWGSLEKTDSKWNSKIEKEWTEHINDLNREFPNKKISYVFNKKPSDDIVKFLKDKKVSYVYIEGDVVKW